MPAARTVRAWYLTHKWTSLVCTIVLLVSCVTGLPMIFSDEIDAMTEHHVAPSAAAPGAPLVPLDDVVAAAKAQHPDLKIVFVTWDEQEPRVLVRLAPTFDPGLADEHTLCFDAHTGAMLEEQRATTGIMDYVSDLHEELYAGLAGELFLCLMALLFVASLVSGFLVYGPFMRKLEFGTLRTRSTRRVRWFDLHNLVGIVTVCWALIVGVTGAMNTLATPLFGLWSGETLPALLALYQGKPMPERYGSVDAAVRTTRTALPNTEITSIVFPNDVFSSPRHYLLWTKGTTTLTSRLFTPVLVDAETGALTTARPLPWYLRALEISRPLHFGDYGGLPLKILWALLDVALIVVLVSGVYLWLSRRGLTFERELGALVALEDERKEAALG